MRRTTIALLAALEASVAALIGLGIALVPLMLLWALHFGLAVDAVVFFRAPPTSGCSATASTSWCSSTR